MKCEYKKCTNESTETLEDTNLCPEHADAWALEAVAEFECTCGGETRECFQCDAADYLASRLAILRNLNSTSAEKCETCKGEGTTTCPECEGSGEWTCGICCGTGITGYVGGPGQCCGECGGNGEVTCETCTERSGEVPCPDCDGEGTA